MRVPLLAAALVMAAANLDARQAPVPAVLPSTLRAHVQKDRFQPVTSYRGLPLGVRDRLQALFGQALLEIADPGDAFQATDDIGNPRLPTRRLVVAGCSADHCLVAYERGGYARTGRVVLLHWTPDQTRVEAGGVSPSGRATVDSLREALLAGAVTVARDW